MNFGSDFTYTPNAQADGNYSDEEVPEHTMMESLEVTRLSEAVQCAAAPPPAGMRRLFGSARMSFSRRASRNPPPVPTHERGTMNDSLFDDDERNEIEPASEPVSASNARRRDMSSAERLHREKKLMGLRRGGGRNYRQRVDTNVISVSLDTLGGEVVVQTGEPKICGTCDACLSNVSQYATTSNERNGPAGGAAEEEEQGNNREDMYDWVCEFCTTQNRVEMDEGELPVQDTDTVDFILEPAPVALARANSTDENMVIFVLDVSGSMCVSVEVPGRVSLRGDRSADLAMMRTAEDDRNQFLPGQRRDVTYISRMQAVQAAINAQLESMSDESPNRIVGLVTFSSDVTVYGDGTGSPTIIAGERLNNLEALLRAGQQAGGSMTSLATSLTPLSEKLFSLEESGPTALGPAIAVALGMTNGQSGAKIVLCTDGLANIGVGSIDEIPDGPNPARSAVEEFYASLGRNATARGVIVDVISIQGDDCDLENLGTLTDLTGGTVTRVDPFGLQNNFAGILQNPVLATSVDVTVLLHRGLEFRDESTDTSLEERELIEGAEKKAALSVMKKRVGNATADTELSFEYQVKSPAERERLGFDQLSELPFQVQIDYTRLDGMRCLRVISQKKPVTTNRKTAEINSKLEVLSAHAMQKSATIAQDGDYYKSRANNRVWQNMMRRCAVNDDRKKQSLATWEKNAAIFDDEVTESMAREESSDEEDYVGAKSYIAKKKATRKAARSKNDNLSSVVYKARRSNLKQF